MKTIQVLEQGAEFLNITAGVTPEVFEHSNKRNYFQCFTESSTQLLCYGKVKYLNVIFLSFITLLFKMFATTLL